MLLFNIFPALENERYSQFFDQCSSFVSCLNPYIGISGLENQFLSFPYSNFMYFVLIPFFLISKYLGISFVILSYFIFEILLLFVLERLYQVSKNHFILIVIFNPLLIYSIAYLGQLDFIPLTYFAISLYFLKLKNKYLSLIFVILAFSSKIIFIILFPVIFIYFIKMDESNRELINTIIYSVFGTLLLNLQLLVDTNYADTVFYGINEGYEALNSSDILLSNNFLLIAIYLSLSIFMLWKNIHRLDFSTISIASGLITLPLYMSNTSNIGWLLWSFILIINVYFSYSKNVKLSLYLFFLVLVIIDFESSTESLGNQFLQISNFIILLGCTFLIYYAYQIVVNNRYYKIKSSPLIISLTGDSAVGKTTLTKMLNKFLGGKFVDNIELDSFHLHERSSSAWKNKTHLNPEMNNLQEYKNTILKLLKGENSLVKNYNHLTGKFDTETQKQIKNFLLIEGLHSMYFDDLNKKYHLNIFLDLEATIKEKSKIQRDILRGKTEKNIKDEIEKRKNDFKEYILPQSKYADIFIKTLERNEKFNVFKIRFNDEYYREFESILSKSNKFVITDQKNSNLFIEFDIKLDNVNVESFFEILTGNIENLRSKNFNTGEYVKKDNFELLSKLGIILYVLEKRISEKV
ncbi:hypothetical protein N9437_03115 [Acidimicrobiia bacterium]|nr:hypothetical protein [Acidimicrobiia bacterium]